MSLSESFVIYRSVCVAPALIIVSDRPELLLLSVLVSSPQLLVSAFANSPLAQADKSINKTDIVSMFISVDCEKWPGEERFRDSVTKKLHIFLHTLAHSLAHRLHNIRKKVEATCKLLTKISLFRHSFADKMFDLLWASTDNKHTQKIYLNVMKMCNV